MESSPSSSSASSSSRSSMLAEPAKIFLGGITKELPEDVLKEYFSAYGEVKNVMVIRDRETGNVRGFGFLEFVNADAVERVIREKKLHLINNRSIEVKRAIPRLKEQINNQSVNHQYSDQSPHDNRGLCTINSNGYNSDENHTVLNKIFVGGLSADVTVTEFRRYFEKFGSINDVVIMYDSVTHRPRGFGFVTFDSDEAVQNVMQNHLHELNEKFVEVKKAVPKDNDHRSYGSNHHRKNGYLREGDGMETYNNYQPGFYPTCGPGSPCYHRYMPQPYPGYAYGPFVHGAYTNGGYGDPWYGVPYASSYASSGAWDGHNYMASRWNPAPTAVYPGYTSYVESYRTMATGGNNGAVFYGNEKSNHGCMNLQNKNYGSTDLQNTNQASTDLQYKNHGSTDLQNTSQASTDLQNKNHGSADLQNTNQASTNLQNTNHGSADLQNTNQASTNLQNMNHGSKDLQNTNQGSMNLQNSNHGSTDLQNSNQASTDLQNKNHGSTNLHDTNQGSTDLQNKNHGSTNLQNMNQGSTDLQNMNQGSTDLQNKNHDSTDLQNTNQASTDLQYKNHGSTDMQYKNQASTDLQDTNQGSTDLLNTEVKNGNSSDNRNSSEVADQKLGSR